MPEKVKDFGRSWGWLVALVGLAGGWMYTGLGKAFQVDANTAEIKATNLRVDIFGDKLDRIESKVDTVIGEIRRTP